MVRIRRFNDFVEFGRQDVEGSISGRFERQVERHPDGVAVDFGDGEVTYKALNAGANRVAHRLLAERGPEPEPVAVLCERDGTMIEARLGAFAKWGKPGCCLGRHIPTAAQQLYPGPLSGDGRTDERPAS